MVVGRLLSYWEGNFSGAMLNFRWVGRGLYDTDIWVGIIIHHFKDPYQTTSYMDVIGDYFIKKRHYTDPY